MRYRLSREKPLSRQLERLVRQELAEALELLSPEPPAPEAIHQARTNVKKVRAVLGLLQDRLGREYGRERKRLRIAAHALATLRDADASIETLELLRQEYHSVLTPAVVAGVQRGVRTTRREARAATDESLGQAREALRRSTKSAPEEVCRVATFGGLRSGAVRAYRRARKALAELGPDSGAPLFHLWRRRLKDHWYQMRLLEGLHPTPRARALTLKEVEGLLGDDHNLAMLREIILSAPDHYGKTRTTALVLGCIAKQQQRLRVGALEVGTRMFDWKAKEFEQALTHWWSGEDEA